MRVLALIAVVLLAGCAGPRGAPPTVELASGQYEAAFVAAKEALAHVRFELDRVDARAGVITTRPKATSGLATPWDIEQSAPGQEIEDLLNRQYRRVRITFEPVLIPGPGDPGAAPSDDLRLAEGPLVCTVSVWLERLHRPGWRVETTSVRLSTFSLDPEWWSQGIWPAYTAPFAQDHRLASRLASRISRGLARTEAPQK